MAFEPEDWLARLKNAGGSIRVDVVKMWPMEGVPLTAECSAIWAEIRGPENLEKWREVEALVRTRVGPITGWADL